MAMDFGGSGGAQPPRDSDDTAVPLDAAIADCVADAGNVPALPLAAPGAHEPVSADLPRFPRALSAERQAFAPPVSADRGFRAQSEAAAAEAQPPESLGAPQSVKRSHPRAAVREDTDFKPGRADRGAFDADKPPRFSGFKFPVAVQSISSGRKLWFAISFLVPVILGALYLFLIAPDQYLTEYRFSVRVPVGQSGTMAAGGSSLSALFGGNPTPGTDLLDNYTVADYVGSAQAAADLNAKINLRDMYNKPADPFSRVGSNASAEKLARYWQSMVYANYDAASGLAIVRVKAYSAQDSYLIANTLLNQSNELANSIGNQSQQDTVRFAKQQFDRATADVSSLRGQLATLAQQRGMDSPSYGVVAANDGVSTTARTNVAEIRAQIAVLMAQLHNPRAPQIVLLRQQEQAVQRQLANAVGVVNQGSTQKFEDVTKRLQAALIVQSSAQSALSQSQAGAESQRLYLTTYVKPRLPESPQAPNRLLDLFILVLFAGMFWLVGMLVGKSIMDHGQ